MKNILSYKALIGLSILVLGGLACSKKEPIGPSINDIYGPFTIQAPFSTSSPAADFTSTTPFYFTAAFSRLKSWTIILKGQTSGGSKTLTGVSSEIGLANATWNGSSDGLFAFKKSETVLARLAIEGYTDTLSTTFTITEALKRDASQDVLVTDFVYAPIQNYGALTVPANKWPSDYPLTTNAQTAYGYVDGNAYLVMGNPSVPWQGAGSPYVDIVTITPFNSMSPNDNIQFHIVDKAETVYFNLWVYGTGTPTWLQIAFLEGGSLVEAARTLDIKPDWIGWKLISKKYTELTPNPKITDAATNIQSNHITGIKFILLSNTPVAGLPGPAVSTAFDHPIFTTGAPYQP